MIYSFVIKGHENVTATHPTTFEFIRESNLSIKGDCIIGVAADFDSAKLNAFKNAEKSETTGLGKLMSIIRAYFDYSQIHSDYYRLNLSVRVPRFMNMLQNDEEDDTEIENAEEYIVLKKEELAFKVVIT